MRSFRAVATLVALLAGAHAAAADAPARDALAPTRVRDLHFGDVLFYDFQGEDFEAITRLNAYEQWGRMPSHHAESQLLLGGLYLALGLHNEAGQRFESLLTPDVPAGVRNRAWFYLGKVWYARGYYAEAERALRKVQAPLAGDLEAQRLHLLANVLMRQQRFDEAVQVLDGWKGPADWLAFARFNLGVALVRTGHIERADPLLTAVGTLDTEQPELLALKDRANLALGYAYLQAGKAAQARTPLERVRLDGPYSNKALLGAGWADVQLGEFQKALQPWLELHGRNLLDSAVQESFLAVPYAYGRLGADGQAAEFYETALLSFDDETTRIDGAIERIGRGGMLDALLAADREQTTNYGVFWQLREVPDAPESRYLYAVLAGNDFQEGLKNYRDLDYMGHTIDRWADSLSAFEDMVVARERAYAERLPRADELLASERPSQLQARRDEAAARLAHATAENDYAVLGSDAERDQWARIERVEAALAGAPDDEQTRALRERLRLVKGVLQFRLSQDFRYRAKLEERAVRDLDAALAETRNRWVRVERARATAPSDTATFAIRIADLRARIADMQGRLLAARKRQEGALEQLAIAELAAQKERIAAYRVQARFALATVYDRAASGPAKPAGERAPAPESSSESSSEAPTPQGEERQP